MNCPNCNCYLCTKERKEEKEQAEIKKMCESWSWNAHPLEVAQILAEMEEAQQQKYLIGICDFFGQYQADEVKNLMEHL